MSDSTDPRRWFTRAAQDLRSAANNLQDDAQALAEVICQDCHAACEKALKGFLLAKGEIPPRIYDLVKLLAECSCFEPTLVEHRKRVVLLNDYFTEVRYPGDSRNEISADEARTAYDEAQVLFKALLELLGPHVSPIHG